MRRTILSVFLFLNFSFAAMSTTQYDHQILLSVGTKNANKVKKPKVVDTYEFLFVYGDTVLARIFLY